MRTRFVPISLAIIVIVFASHATWRYRTYALIARVADFGRCDASFNPLMPIPLPVPASSSEIPTRVFASHPLNDRNILYVDRGASARVRRMMPVFDSSRVLIGQVVEVSKEYSAVLQVGSPDWEIPVRIGERKISGLLVGGPTIHVTMIAGDASIAPGDTVFAASSELPYGALIGTVLSIGADPAGGVFQDAVVRLSYSASELTDAVISVWTPDF